MINIFVNYLLQSSLCLMLFVATYRLLISNLTHFAWMRFYLICSLTLSLVLPLIIIPIQWDSKLFVSESLSTALQLTTQQSETFVNSPSQTNLIKTPSQFTPQMVVLYFILTVYLIGVVFKMYSFSKNLNNIFSFIKKNPRVKEANYWLVNIKNEIPAFSFFNYIFINNNYKNLSTHELQLIKDHEIVHVKQYHTLDLLFVEIIGILFWFNPLMSYLRKSIQEVHEYIVDERIAGQGENKKVYAHLLLNLASDSKVFDLVTSFTGEHIKRRVLMITRPKASAKYKLMFIILVPLTAILLLSFSYIKNQDLASSNTDKISGKNKLPYVTQLTLEKYCGVYIPLKPGPIVVDIRLKNNTLRTYLVLVKPIKPIPGIPWTQDSASCTTELNHVSDNKFDDDSLFKNANNIEFILNNDGEVTGCLLTQREGLKFVTHEFKKQK